MLDHETLTYNIKGKALPGFDEAERAGDAHGVEDVDGLRGDGGVRQEREHHLLPGRRQPVEPGRADEPQELQAERRMDVINLLRSITPPHKSSSPSSFSQQSRNRKLLLAGE